MSDIIHARRHPSHLEEHLRACNNPLCLVYGLANVVAHILVFKLNPLGCLVSLGSCLLEVLAESGYAEHAAAVGHDALIGELGSGVETEIIILAVKILETGDKLAFLVSNRITVGCENDTYAGIILELKVYLVESAVNAGLEYVDYVILHTRKNNLCLRVTKTCVVLKHLRSLRSKHETEENYALERSSLRFHGINRCLIYMFFAEFINFRGVERTW